MSPRTKHPPFFLWRPVVTGNAKLVTVTYYAVETWWKV